ncbi:hypothetical protein [Streptomyces agglomeratus]|uniref:hypothetical protein n=1 Tax=Streptomyces agglomeratus TaxID=285458 RepID=UPI00085506C2|nr:hypothetical protein [Streptomyces agglomeratus]OEJ52055.1 hypothetical protein BGK72_16015 [Streptomyces agglomeratus]
MGLFSRDDRDDDMGERIDRAKRQGSELSRIKHAHRVLDSNRPTPDTSGRGNPSGPSCGGASTPKRGRRW